VLALALARQRKFSEAAAQLKVILQEHPDHILAYERLGQLTELRPEDFPDSNDWFNEAVKNNPSSALAYIVRAGFHRRNKDNAKTLDEREENNAKALADLEQAEKQDLSDPNVELRLAGEFIYANILDKAEEHLTAVQEAMPTDQNLWQIWAQLALKSQSQEKMLEIAETGLKELSSQPWDFMPIATELFIRCGKRAFFSALGFYANSYRAVYPLWPARPRCRLHHQNEPKGCRTRDSYISGRSCSCRERTSVQGH